MFWTDCSILSKVAFYNFEFVRIIGKISRCDLSKSEKVRKSHFGNSHIQSFKYCRNLQRLMNYMDFIFFDFMWAHNLDSNKTFVKWNSLRYYYNIMIEKWKFLKVDEHRLLLFRLSILYVWLLSFKNLKILPTHLNDPMVFLHLLPDGQ